LQNFIMESYNRVAAPASSSLKGWFIIVLTLP
jgi:predicted P-loop ATPase/GTPase